MFHRKVHPESSSVSTRCDEVQKCWKKKHNSHGIHKNKGRIAADKEIMAFPERRISKEKIKFHESQSDPGCNGSKGIREYWIKTDADCKYRCISIF